MNQQMHYILLALGSNTLAQHNIELAKAYLTAAFPKIQFSRLLVTPAIGIVSPPFINCLAQTYCCEQMADVLATLKNIETAMGSMPEKRRKGIVKIDIDLLQFDETRHKADDWERDYIQLLLKELGYKQKTNT
jgi:7,8-dihydro-6-hydroxymethylpterin-pyrophosphokinase (HPPK)